MAIPPLNPLQETAVAASGTTETPAATLADNRPYHGEPPGNAGLSSLHESHDGVSSGPATAAPASPAVPAHQPEPLASAPYPANPRHRTHSATEAREQGLATEAQTAFPARQALAARADAVNTGLSPGNEAPHQPESISADVAAQAWRSPEQALPPSSARDDRPGALKAVHIGEIHIRVVEREPATRSKPSSSRSPSSGNDSRSLTRSL